MKTVFNRARRLASLLTNYDQKQSAKRGHNPHALAQYMGAVDAWESDKKAESDPIGALSSYFTHNPADASDFCMAPVRQFVREIRADKI